MGIGDGSRFSCAFIYPVSSSWMEISYYQMSWSLTGRREAEGVLIHLEVIDSMTKFFDVGLDWRGVGESNVRFTAAVEMQI